MENRVHNLAGSCLYMRGTILKTLYIYLSVLRSKKLSSTQNLCHFQSPPGYHRCISTSFDFLIPAPLGLCILLVHVVLADGFTGGLIVGDLDSEDTSCRRMCQDTNSVVYSVDYRLTPENSPSVSLDDAYDAFVAISRKESSRLIVAGSSSGGQLAAQVAEMARDLKINPSTAMKAINGVLLRCPVTVDASEGGIHIPERFRGMHKSWNHSFDTTLLRLPTTGSNLKEASNLPLLASTFAGLPPTFVQVTTNDIYYSDGVCYSKALRDAGVPLKIDVVQGWPHTFWLKAPHLDRALRADLDMIDGLNWLLSL